MIAAQLAKILLQNPTLEVYFDSTEDSDGEEISLTPIGDCESIIIENDLDEEVPIILISPVRLHGTTDLSKN
jgi:hypothetical protein